MQNRFSKKLTVGLAIGLFALAGSGAAVYAASTGSSLPSDPPTISSSLDFRGGRAPGGELDFSALVSSGVIDQATADKMTAYISEKKSHLSDAMQSMTETERRASREGQPERIDSFTAMVNDGVISQEQADAIQAALSESGALKGDSQGRSMHMNWDEWVSNGVIDQATANALEEYYADKAAARQAQKEAVESMTEAERPAGGEGPRGEQHSELLADAVSDGIITQAQADAIKAAMPSVPSMPAKPDSPGEPITNPRGEKPSV